MTYPIEPDLAESWTRTDDTTYVFKLRKDVRWHPEPPVNGRELTADDVKYTYERFLSIKGTGNRPVLETIDKIETPDKHTVKFILKAPNAWFLDHLASTSTWTELLHPGPPLRRCRRRHHRQGPVISPRFSPASWTLLPSTSWCCVVWISPWPGSGGLTSRRSTTHGS